MDIKNWQQFFLQNPVMFIYATRLLWGIYNEQGELIQTFLCNEDTSLIDVEQEEITIEAGVIGIVHPSQLDSSQLQQWKQLFFDLSIDPNLRSIGSDPCPKRKILISLNVSYMLSPVKK
jgi:hypothetical protein